jgi:hypothetical protein
MSNIQLYVKKATIEPTDDKSFEVFLEDVDAGDFTSEFTIGEVLDQYDFADIEKEYLIRKGEDDEDWS